MTKTEIYLVEHEHRWDLLEHDQSFTLRDLSLNIGQLAIDVVESRLRLFPRSKDVLSVDGLPNHLLVQLIRTLLEIRMLFGMASTRVTIEFLVEPIQLPVSFVHLLILFHLLVQQASVFVDARWHGQETAETLERKVIGGVEGAAFIEILLPTLAGVD